jgi:hypothetical protein
VKPERRRLLDEDAGPAGYPPLDQDQYVIPGDHPRLDAWVVELDRPAQSPRFQASIASSTTHWPRDGIWVSIA